MQNKWTKIVLLFLGTVLTLAMPLWAESKYSGKVVSISDGDTITVLVDKTQHKVRLAAIDCPEKKQAFGNKARQFTSELVMGQIVKVEAKKKDRYGRDLGHVYTDGKHVNAELLRAGLAWHFKQYNEDPELARLEDEARSAARGLWVDKNPVPPWEFRKQKGRQSPKK